MPKPTTKITEDMYQALLREFSADKAAKDEAKLLKSNRDPKPAAVIPVATKPSPAVEVLATVEPKALTPEPIPQEKMASKLEELAGPKILRKIDIGKKKTVEAPPVKEETPVKEVVLKPVVVEKSIEVPPVVEAPSTPVVAVEVADTVVETPAARVVKTPATPVVAPAAETLEDDDVEKINTKFEKIRNPLGSKSIRKNKPSNACTNRCKVFGW